MKSLFILSSIIFTYTFISAQTEVFYPSEEPVYSIDVPEGWGTAVYEDYKVLEIYNRNQSVIYSIYELETILLFEAVNRAHAEAVTECYKHEFGERTEEEINGITFHKISGSGITDNEKFINIEIRLFRFDYSKFFMIYYSGLPEDLEKYKNDLYHLKYTLKAQLNNPSE